MLTMFNPRNKHIHKAFEELKKRHDAGTPVVALRMVGATWAPLDQRKLLAERAQRFGKALQAWGGCQVTEVTGNAAEGFFCTIPGLRYTSLAPVANPPLSDAIKLLPWGRPASPWTVSNFLWRTPDGKPFPYAAYSSLQDAWITLISSPMGGGKSVQINAFNLGLILDPENETIPQIRTLDIGPSSSGLPSLVSSALPPGKEHLAQYHRIQNSHEHAFNPCDTPLGLRFPLPAHRDYLVELLCLLATPLDADAPQDGVHAIAQQAVELAYHRFSDEPTAHPRKYAQNVAPTVDEAVAKHAVVIDDSTTWWELVDTFHDAGDFRAAHAAQLNAMPLITDIGACARDDVIAKLYPDTAAQGGISLTDYFRRKMSEAHNQYKVLQRHTRFEIGDVPIVALDLDEVAKGNSAAAKRQGAVFYIMGLWKLSSDFFIGDEVLALIPERYRKYHAGRVATLKRSKKRIVADEFHRPVQ